MNVLAQGHNIVMPVRLEPAAPRFRVKHSTTEPLCSLVSNIPDDTFPISMKTCLNIHAQLHSGARGLYFSLIIHLLLYYVHVNSEGSDEAMQMCRLI